MPRCPSVNATGTTTILPGGRPSASETVSETVTDCPDARDPFQAVLPLCSDTLAGSVAVAEADARSDGPSLRTAISIVTFEPGAATVLSAVTVELPSQDRYPTARSITSRRAGSGMASNGNEKNIVLPAPRSAWRASAMGRP